MKSPARPADENFSRHDTSDKTRQLPLVPPALRSQAFSNPKFQDRRAARRSQCHSVQNFPTRGRRRNFDSSDSSQPGPQRPRRNAAARLCPGLMNWPRQGGKPSTIKSIAQDTAMTASVARPRQTRSVGTGEHFAIGRQQLPSGNGPDSHAPPGRVQRQRPLLSPGLVSRTGRHSAVARQRPFSSGPCRHGWPLQAWPQIQF